MDRPTQNTRLPLPDPEIVDLYWARNERAIDETDFKYKRFLYTIAQNIIHDRMDSEECLNDTYLGAWQQIPPAKPDPLQAFLAKIMRHIAIDRYRQKSASKRIPSQLSISIAELGECISPAENPEEALLTKELARILNRFVKDLEDEDEFISDMKDEIYQSDDSELAAEGYSIEDVPEDELGADLGFDTDDYDNEEDM